MKKLIHAFIVTSLIFLSFLISPNSTAKAAIGDPCVGETSGENGVCVIGICGGTADGNAGCGPALNCCLIPDPPQCEGFCGAPGVCVTGFCGGAREGGCPGGNPLDKCCVDPTFECPVNPFQPTTCYSIELCGPPGDDIVCQIYPPIKTGIGCIPTYPAGFLFFIVSILIKISGGIALLIMIVGAFFILTSQGQPERIKRGKEIFIGGVTGLIIVIFSTFILELIAVDITNLL